MTTPRCDFCGLVLHDRFCPSCGTNVQDATAVDLQHKHPSEGDWTICVYCSSLAIFTKDGLREPTDEERDEMLANLDMQKAITAVRRVREEGWIPDGD